MKLSSLALAGGIALSSASGIQAKECQPGSLGYQAFPAASWLPTLTETCVVDRQTSIPFQTNVAYTKANIAGRDTGTLKTGEAATIVAGVHAQALARLDDIIKAEGTGLIERHPPVINISGSIIGTASPDVNLVGGTLKSQSGQSPAYALYRRTRENMETARKRCMDLLTMIPATLSRGGKDVRVTAEGLQCEPRVLTLDEEKWGAKLTKLGNALIDGGYAPSNFDEAQILAVKMANGKASIPESMNREMKLIILELKSELEAMRVVPVNGEMKVTVKVNTTEVDVTNVVLLGGAVGVLFLLALRRRSTRDNTSDIQLAHR